MSGDSGNTESSEVFRWTVNMFAAEPQKRYVVLAASMVGGAVGWVLFQNIVMALIGILAILGATAESWLPISYTLNEKGATSRCGLSVSTIEWGDVKRVIMGESGIKLSPLEEETRAAPFRGVFLRPNGNLLEITERIRRNIGKDVRFVE